MNAVEYVKHEAFTFGYCGKLEWSTEHNGLVPTKRNFGFMQGRIFTEDDPFELRSYYGDLLADEITACASELEKNLIANAFKYLEDWSIDLTKYEGSVEFDDVTCEIMLTHKINRVGIVFKDTYFTQDGEILQTVLSF